MFQVTATSPPETKVRLFRSLFRGRDDIYPRRFESRRSGKSGYAPACANEWIVGICDKPRIKCGDCHNRRFLPVTDEVIRCHLSGRDPTGRDFVVGAYPMLLDETCYFLAVDFDKVHWQQDAIAFLDTCRKSNLPAALERSRSGNGGHVWLFFEQAISANLARSLGAHLLTETSRRRPDVGLDSYDRFFPNQDTLPRGGFGNLIALPLQKRARQRGNTVFVNDELVPYDDQWAFLSRIRKIEELPIEQLIRRATAGNHVVGVQLIAMSDDMENPWAESPSRRHKFPPIQGALPSELELVLGNEIYLAKAELPPALRDRVIRAAAFQNPEFYKAQAMRLPTYDKPRIIACAQDHPNHVSLPRGCLEDVVRLLTDLRVKPIIRDQRCLGTPLNVEFHGQLRQEQKLAAESLLQEDIGVLAATTAFGKTVVAAWLIAKRAVNTLIVVHRRQLMEQWIARLSQFLEIPTPEIGRIGGGKNQPNGKLDVALIQSLIRKGVVDDRVGDYGHLIVDECHHLAARNFEEVARRAKAKYVTGLSATVTRKDGHQPIIFMQCGPVRYRVDDKQQALARPFDHTVHVCPTSFRMSEPGEYDARQQFQELYTQLISDESRNQMICDQVLESVAAGRSPLVLTERKEHLDRLSARLAGKVTNLIVLRGGMGKKQLAAATSRLTEIPDDQSRVLLATGRFIGEGFDDPRLDTLLLTLPVSWRGTIAQYVGRLHRLHEGKREVRVYDYADLNVPMLAKMFDRRCKGYQAVGYRILLPASAVPGWPAEASLPVDPEWKKDFAATVRRLARDGVDTSLANLYLNVTRTVKPGALGEARARSATEAFFFRRLETLDKTSGRFQLNADLPIAFNGRGQMEVDFLAADTKVVVELDGAQHLSDADAYRRDRRKDMLLQQHGYLVLRFLAEDVGKNLDSVLDAVHRALEHRKHQDVSI